ncbi:hypothetical protein ACW5BZ_03190 [Pediococcus pentosaceus]
MNYQAKHFTAPLFNKSKVLSGVLVTSSVLAGMLLVQNNYVSADSISAKSDISVTAKSLDQTDTKTVVEGNIQHHYLKMQTQKTTLMMK